MRTVVWDMAGSFGYDAERHDRALQHLHEDGQPSS